MQSTKQFYLAGAITHLGDEEYINWYEEIGSMLEQLGIRAFIPHKDIHSPKHKPAQEIHQANLIALENSQALIAYVGRPSLGVGMTLQKAVDLQIPTILISETNATVSEMVLHTRNIIDHLRFENFEDALLKLEERIAEGI